MHVVHRIPSAKADRNAGALDKQDMLPTRGAEHIPSQLVGGTAGMVRLRCRRGNSAAIAQETRRRVHPLLARSWDVRMLAYALIERQATRQTVRRNRLSGLIQPGCSPTRWCHPHP